jgi:hypothetical protein
LEATVPITNAAPPNTTAVAIANAFPTIKLKTKKEIRKHGHHLQSICSIFVLSSTSL